MAKFKFKPFEQMTPADYAEIGFKAGLEVHQQLLTEKKLFCRCPAGQIHNDGYHTEILRHMRPTLSELGEYDGTALMEFKTKKNITYRIHYDTVCTYEMDDNPPFLINDQALDIAIEVGLLYGASIVDELHIARKQYLDGSIPTGFQRTAITCVGGKVPYKNGRDINLIQMSIEEDSCRETHDIGHDRVYLTDRLGTPLIETVTHPEMKTPHEIAEVNEIIRKLARTTGKVRQGIGSGRQDVNVSVEGGTRIEIKGVPRIKEIPRLAYHESMRQWNLLLLRDELHSRGITEETFNAETTEITSLLRKTKYATINQAITTGNFVYAVTLKGFKDLLNWETQTDTYFSKEISDRVRVIACLTTLPNILHSDNARENLTGSEWMKIKSHANVDENDTVILVWGNKEDTDMATKEIIIRAKEATIGIPSETRQAYREGTNGFERILPGADRMYPDTDLPPVTITLDRLDRIAEEMPTPYWEHEDYLRKFNLNEQLIGELATSNKMELFHIAINEFKLEANLVGKMLIEYPKKLAKTGYDISYLDDYTYKVIMEEFSKGSIQRESMYYVLQASCYNKGLTNILIPKMIGHSDLVQTIANKKEEIKDIELLNNNKYNDVLMGMVMTELRGKVNGKTVKEIIENGGRK